MQSLAASTRRVLAAALIAAALTVTACGDDSGSGSGSPENVATTEVEPATPSADTTETTDPMPEPPPEEEPALPSDLVGTWVSTGQGNAELIYRFASDGGFEHAGVLLQQRASGRFTFEVAAAGTAEADGDSLVLRQETLTKSLTDPDVPSSSYRNRPSEPQVERYRFSVDGDTLTLTGGEQGTITFRRE